MGEAFKNFFISLWDGFKKDIIYIALIIVMVCWAITSMRSCTNQLQENDRLEHNIEALSNSAWAYYSTGDYNNAKLTVNKILAYDKTNKNAQDLLNSIYENEYSTQLHLS